MHSARWARNALSAGASLMTSLSTAARRCVILLSPPLDVQGNSDRVTGKKREMGGGEDRGKVGEKDGGGGLKDIFFSFPSFLVVVFFLSFFFL